MNYYFTVNLVKVYLYMVVVLDTKRLFSKKKISKRQAKQAKKRKKKKDLSGDAHGRWYLSRAELLVTGPSFTHFYPSEKESVKPVSNSYLCEKKKKKRKKDT